MINIEEDFDRTVLVQICNLNWWRPRFCRLFKLVYKINCDTHCANCPSEQTDQKFYIYEE